ncbi:hypothetical protein [Cryobacterium sp. CG_9.6]|uniref:hypothetical protein n=1 Tax=Cryobacterium sp. CG_9.6 TaxID=2760710 RepID=UPI002474C567|nr:hypothetical protein [Cryobacterium sp. CG_9.6]MDH6238052.1 type II secretory pathway pseudopilin PulG [Cryobacterium sp. CG_9.6]
MKHRGNGRASATDAGFGLIEIVVSMFLLALLAVAFLPFLVQGITKSSVNSTLAAATQLVNREMEGARAQTTCSALTATTYSVPDARGVTLQVRRTVGPIDTVGASCPASLTSYPVTVPVGVTVARTDTGAVVSSAKTLIFVTAQ